MSTQHHNRQDRRQKKFNGGNPKVGYCTAREAMLAQTYEQRAAHKENHPHPRSVLIAIQWQEYEIALIEGWKTPDNLLEREGSRDFHSDGKSQWI